MKIEKTILKNLLKNEEYARKVLPFLKEEYFTNQSDKILFKEINDFILKYNVVPSFDALTIEVESIKTTDEQIKSVLQLLNDIKSDNTETTTDWLLDATEKLCQEKAIYNAIMTSVDILDGKTKMSKGMIPELLSDALAVSFDPNVGHDYLEQYLDRYEHYHEKATRIPFDIDYFNKITKNGLKNKTLNVCLAPTGAGKTLFMCHVGAHALTLGKNVLYITMEISEEEISKRIDANLLNIKLDDLMKMPKTLYKERFESYKAKTNGKLFVKEYPTASASTIHFKALLNELALKKGFKPDLIIIDYINICASARIKPGGNANLYTYIKSIAEELRGLAVEYDVPVLTATQVNRAGFNSSDFGLENTSESFGLPATADLMFALINTEELEALNQLLIKQLKSRYGDPGSYRRFVIGVDKAKMKLYNVDEKAQVESLKKTETLGRDDYVSNPIKLGDLTKDKFKGFKV